MKTFPDPSGSGVEQKLSVTNTSGLDVPVKKQDLIKLVDSLEHHEQVKFRFIELVYINEEKIKEVNQEYLEKTYITDIITFRYDEDSFNRNIEGTLFCCSPRIAEQSREVGSPEVTEFYRIFIHGLLHLAGYDDQTEEQKSAMTARENHYLQELNLPL